jgi:hypothetical protein
MRKSAADDPREGAVLAVHTLCHPGRMAGLGFDSLTSCQLLHAQRSAHLLQACW